MLAADTFMIVFRFLHIVTGVAWVGSAFLFVGFIGPSAAEVGPSACRCSPRRSRNGRSRR